MIDVENLVRDGKVGDRPEYSQDYKNWKYRLTGVVDERSIEVLIALDSSEDYEKSPLAILLTAYVKDEPK